MFVAGSGAHTDVLAACQVLFGPDVAVSRDFLAILHPGGARAAYCRRARETHPDLHPADPHIQQHQSHLFHEVTAAYRRVAGYCERRADTVRQAVRPSQPAPAAAPAKKKGSEAVRANEQSGTFFRGEMPKRRMVIGRYLYYRGIISYQLLLESLTWQRRQRPSIGKLARDWGWLDDHEVIQVLVAAKRAGRFGERAQELGVLNDFQVKLLLRTQKLRQRRLGEFFVAGGHLTQRQLTVMLADMQFHNAAVIPA